MKYSSFCIVTLFIFLQQDNQLAFSKINKSTITILREQKKEKSIIVSIKRKNHNRICKHGDRIGVSDVSNDEKRIWCTVDTKLILVQMYKLPDDHFSNWDSKEIILEDAFYSYISKYNFKCKEGWFMVGEAVLERNVSRRWCLSQTGTLTSTLVIVKDHKAEIGNQYVWTETFRKTF